MTLQTRHPGHPHVAALAAFLCFAVCCTLPACAARDSTSPYTAREADRPRDSRRADQCNSRAVDLMDSDPAQAEKLLREALAADLYHGPAHNNLGVLLLAKGEFYEAAGEFEWGRKLLPGSPDPRINLALTLERAGHTDEALLEYRNALEVRPGHIPATQALARLEVTSGKRSDETLQRLKVVALEGETPEWREWAQGELSKAADR